MYNISIELAQQVADTYGVVTNTQLVADGATHHQIRELVSHDVIIRCHNGVYRVATSPATFESACAAACIADPSIVITGLAAAGLWGFRHAGTPTAPIALVEHGRHPLAPGVTIRRTNVLTTIHRVQRDDGIAIASPPRTWFDRGRDLNDDRFEAMTEWVLDHHSSTPTLWRTVREMDARGRPGLARVRRVLSQRSTWQRPAGSKLELRVLKALKPAGFQNSFDSIRSNSRTGSLFIPTGPTQKSAGPSRWITSRGTAARSMRSATRGEIAGSIESVGRSNGSTTKSFAIPSAP
ncbi:MAG: hypothetical protein ACJAXA_000624 [Candidatus Aldehydirespiratoraceae bacterium]|jgi:hypothetical protein